MITRINGSMAGSVFTNVSEFSKNELQELVSAGFIKRIDNHKEHFAIQPCWIGDVGSGVMQEISQTALGKWNNKLKAYVVSVDNVRNYENSAGMNEDHRWLHIDITATFYVYSPQVGQCMRGEITKVGNTAAICIFLDVFTATIFAKDETELHSWNVGDQLYFKIFEYEDRRKGPIIRANYMSQPGEFTESPNKRMKFSSDEEEEKPCPSYSMDRSPSPIKSKKRSKKSKHKDKQDETFEDNDNTLQLSENEKLMILNIKQEKCSDDEATRADDPEEHISKKKKKKKKKPSNERDNYS